MLVVANLTEKIHGVLSRLIRFEPFLTRAEVCKVGASHYMTIRNAERDILYTPLITAEEGLQRAAAHFGVLVLPHAWRVLALWVFLATIVFAIFMCCYIPWRFLL